LNQQEREMIDGLFDRLRQAEQQGEPRDAEAEALIQERMANQPSASYLLAQVVLVQEQGLKNLQGRVEQLEKELAERPQASTGGFLGGLFGGASQAKPTPPPPPAAPQPASAAGQPKRAGWSNPTDPAAAARPGMAPGMAGQGGAAAGRGGGFMAGAMQTAMGVAGGVLLANAVTGMFAGDSEAAEAAAPADAEPPADEPMADEPMDAPPEDDGDLFGGDFFGGDEEF
jgi:hypothetical protein